MQTQDAPQSRVRRTVNDLVLAEMFLLQATIESATVIGEGFSELGKQIGDSEVAGQDSWASISSTLQRIADNALEPYTSRFNYFRDVVNKDS
jgi:hypothetical protein